MFPPSRSDHGHRDADGAIRLTDSDAAIARLSAVHKGYIQDPFIKYLVPRAHLQPARPPLINIGTFVRSEAIDSLVYRWLELAKVEDKKCQIVSLGAGSDTRFWRIATGPYKDYLAAYLELDFAEVTTKKAMGIRKSKDLNTVLGRPEDVIVSHGGTALHAAKYHLLPVDLRLPPSQTLSSLLANPENSIHSKTGPLLSSSLPTLLLFECVLVYMSPAASSALIQWFVDYFSTEDASDTIHSESGPLGAIVYEMFGLNDSFGRVMRSNLQSRGVSMPGVEPYPNLASLPSRFLKHNFMSSHALTLRDIRRAYIERAKLNRISNLEMLDEIEELDLVLEHYAITWGVKLPERCTLKARWSEWGLRSTAKETEGLEED